ncbi:MAG: hemolysin family protein [Bacteroidia bacterium]|nr:hemolysin family protein [Bacteroidia bacterium]
MSWLVLGLVALILSAVASGSEMAWLSANPLQWENWRNRHPHRWRIAQFFLKRPRRLLITLLLGNNLALIGFSAGLSESLKPLLVLLSPSQRFWIETLFGTLLLLTAGEYFPKVFSQRWHMALLPVVIPLTGLAYFLLWPLVEVVYRVTTAFFHLLRLKEDSFQKPLTRESVAHLVQTTEPDFREVITKALALNETPVRDFMVPRREVVSIPHDAPISELHRTFIETELSRLLVYDKTPDQIVGYIHVRSLLHSPRSILEVTEPVSFVPETMPATRLLEELVREKRALAVVVDARGGVAGIVTTEDLVEEVFGEIQDEYDEPEWLEKMPSPNTYELDARLEIDYLNEKYGLGLPSHEAVTLGGLAMAHLGRIPPTGTTWETHGFRWEVLSATPQRILSLKLERL